MDQREIAARLSVVEALVLSALRRFSTQQRHELLTGLLFQFGQEPGVKMIVEEWRSILDLQAPDEGQKLDDIHERIFRHS